MHLEGLVTSLDYALVRVPGSKFEFVDLLGVFQSLPEPTARFIVYIDLRRGAEDSADLNIRIRRARGRRAVLFETGPQLVLAYQPHVQLPVEIDGLELPPGGVVVEVLIDGRLTGSRVVHFGDEEEVG